MQNTDCEHATSHPLQSHPNPISREGRRGARGAAAHSAVRARAHARRTSAIAPHASKRWRRGAARAGRVPTAAAAAPPPSPPPSVPCRRRRGPLATLTARAAVAAASSSGVQPSRADGDRRRAARRRRPCRRAQRHHLRRAQGAASERRRRWEMAHVVRLSFGWSARRAQGRRAGVRRGPDQGGDAPGPAVPPRGTPPARRFSGVIGQRRDSLVDAGRWLELSLASSVSVLGRLL